MGRFSGLGSYLLAFILILGLNFFLPRMMSGDPLIAIYGPEALMYMSPEMINSLTETMGLNQSVEQQFINYIKNLVHGDLGYSYYYNSSVGTVIAKAFPWTVLLVGISFFVNILLGILLGLESGWRRGSLLDKCLLTLIMVFNGFPDFFLAAILLLIFSVQMELLPLSGAITPYAELSGLTYVVDVFKHLVLPVASLTIVNFTGLYLLTRNTVVGILGEKFVETAKAKGLQPLRVRYKHVGRNALLPVIAFSSIQIGRLITGALFVELVFSYPGLGLILKTALLSRDYALLQGVLLMVSIFILTLSLLVELFNTKIDPRLEKCILTTGKNLKLTK